MAYEEITSRANPKIKEAAQLLTPQGRKKTGMFLTEGARLCADAVSSGIVPVTFFCTENAAAKYPKAFGICSRAAEKTYFIHESVAQKLSDTSDTQQMFCVCRKRSENENAAFDPNGFYILTENVQNPDNLGAAARSCEALGADGLIAASGCDIYSPKALRASMGALLRLRVIRISSAPDMLRKLKADGMKIFSAVVTPDAESIVSADKSGGCVCVIGNEGNGVSEEVKALSDHLITIPMKGRAESLNAAAATAITVWEFVKNR